MNIAPEPDYPRPSAAVLNTLNRLFEPGAVVSYEQVALCIFLQAWLCYREQPFDYELVEYLHNLLDSRDEWERWKKSHPLYEPPHYNEAALIFGTEVDRLWLNSLCVEVTVGDEQFAYGVIGLYHEAIEHGTELQVKTLADVILRHMRKTRELSADLHEGLMSVAVDITTESADRLDMLKFWRKPKAVIQTVEG